MSLEPKLSNNPQMRRGDFVETLFYRRESSQQELEIGRIDIRI